MQRTLKSWERGPGDEARFDPLAKSGSETKSIKVSGQNEALFVAILLAWDVVSREVEAYFSLCLDYLVLKLRLLESLNLYVSCSRLL